MKKLIPIMTLMLFMAMPSSAQETVTVKFTASTETGLYHQFSSITATNLTRGWTETLLFPDTVLVMHNTVGVSECIDDSFHLHDVYPNPFTNQSYTILEISSACTVLMQLLNADGREIVSSRLRLDVGTYRIALNLSEPQLAFFVVTTPYGRRAVKLMHIGQGGENSIDVSFKSEGISSGKKFNPMRVDAIGEFVPGDMMRYEAQLSDSGLTLHSIALTQPQYNDEIVILSFEVPVGAIDGLFSVSLTKQVYFSRGNLQYQASTNTWRFAGQQYDYIGYGNENISQTYNGWIDLFGWGTSGWDNGNINFCPWDSDRSCCECYGPPGPYNLTGSYANSDWGRFNSISNGGDRVNNWRTLTIEEWDYVINIRNTSSGLRYAKARVNNVNGVILLPDKWTTNYYILNNANQNESSFSSNVLDSSTWMDSLQVHGAVFLPAAGDRYGTSIHWIDGYNYGSYWSASYYNDSTAYDVYFCDDDLGTYNLYERCYGHSVRLVYSPNNNHRFIKTL